MSPRHPSSDDWAEDTRPDIVKPFPSVKLKAAPESEAPASASVRVLDSEPPLSTDPDHQVGVLMAAIAKNDRALAESGRRMGLLEREVGALRRDIEQDREELVRGASKKAATHSSNRLAAIMAGAFTAWEIVSPYVRDLIELLKAHHS